MKGTGEMMFHNYGGGIQLHQNLSGQFINGTQEKAHGFGVPLAILHYIGFTLYGVLLTRELGIGVGVGLVSVFLPIGLWYVQMPMNVLCLDYLLLYCPIALTMYIMVMGEHISRDTSVSCVSLSGGRGTKYQVPSCWSAVNLCHCSCPFRDLKTTEKVDSVVGDDCIDEQCIRNHNRFLRDARFGSHLHRMMIEEKRRGNKCSTRAARRIEEEDLEE